MKRGKFFVIAGIVLVLALLAFIAMVLLRRPVDKAEPAPVFVDRPAPAIAPAAAQAAATKAPGDAAAQKRLGDAMLAARRFDEAAAAYRASLAIDPNQSTAWSALGEAVMQTTKSNSADLPAPAAEAFRKALALDPRDARARFYFAMEKDLKGQHDEAVGDWLALLRDVPAGSDADEAVRAALAASIKRNIALIRQAADEAGRAQPRYKSQP
ncbi:MULTISPECIES: tetratricopeptide repeat protein [unclassified Sphingomonas]|uniref:tetratricopeptide repeat protein n=1 Tax=unclassified Sphingomonas TaxID=196159 RepID=UPI002862CF47|nr:MULTISPECIES: tetratricopeptide repeat protein [unclassified Sphingomonas]MDR6116383.1 cytochrome c-type biogenesis protein CcmH [Sphingomonas sp. SORGH_AS_0789]MDR6149942.1 cytochrome c-type biogenesis protein CcmH [Sphingomonas sp. SORGH_AS_0742]